jgi:hypothetical protein
MAILSFSNNNSDDIRMNVSNSHDTYESKQYMVDLNNKIFRKESLTKSLVNMKRTKTFYCNKCHSNACDC